MKKRIAAKIIFIGILIIVVTLASGYTLEQIKGEKSSTEEEILAEKIEQIKTIYSEEYQEQVQERLEKTKSSADYTEECMLIEPNPYGTNTLSLYVYFKTEEPAKVSYSISSEDSDIADFAAVPSSEEEYGTEHEFQVIGLVPDMKNTVTFTVTWQDGTEETYEYVDKTGSVSGEEETFLETTEVQQATSDQLTDGLYVILGNDSDELDFMYYYDNDGVLRGEVPLIGYRSHRLLFQDGLMYYSISETQIAAMNSLGKIEQVYDTGNYELHHDYVFDDENNLIILASATQQDSVEDVIIQMDLETGEIVGTLDLAEVFGDYKASCEASSDEELDWIHINTVQWLEEETLILSSRETSTIIKITSAFSEPQVEYMIGSQSFWEGTYSLVQSFEVPFSAYVSSAQEYEENIIVDSGMAGVFGEYDSDGNLLQQFEMKLAEKYMYRVYKYDFSEFLQIGKDV